MTIKYNEETKLRLGIHYYIIECLTSSVRNFFCIIYCYLILFQYIVDDITDFSVFFVYSWNSSINIA